MKINHVSRIPLEDRAKGRVGKSVWKSVARMVQVPEWVIERSKIGFCDALKDKK